MSHNYNRICHLDVGVKNKSRKKCYYKYTLAVKNQATPTHSHQVHYVTFFCLKSFSKTCFYLILIHYGKPIKIFYILDLIGMVFVGNCMSHHISKQRTSASATLSCVCCKSGISQLSQAKSPKSPTSRESPFLKNTEQSRVSWQKDNVTELMIKRGSTLAWLLLEMAQTKGFEML